MQAVVQLLHLGTYARYILLGRRGLAESLELLLHGLDSPDMRGHLCHGKDCSLCHDIYHTVTYLLCARLELLHARLQRGRGQLVLFKQVIRG